MKKETKLIILEKLKNWINGIPGIMGIIFIVFIISVVSMLYAFNSINDGITYPGTEYVKLEKEFYNVITPQNKIDFHKISDKDISCKEFYESGNSYQTYEISLSRNTIKVFGSNISVKTRFENDINRNSMILERNCSWEFFTLIKIIIYAVIGIAIILCVFFAMCGIVTFILFILNCRIKKLSKELSVSNE